jgi:glycerate 2-kinase
MPELPEIAGWAERPRILVGPAALPVNRVLRAGQIATAGQEMEIYDMARRLAAVALAAVDPERLVRQALAARPRRWAAALALGKAAPAMARGAAEALRHLAADRAAAVRAAAVRAATDRAEADGAGGAERRQRLLVRTHGTPGLLDPAWEQLSGGHPLPDRQSLAAGERVLRWLGEMAPGAPLLALVSGGSSACVEAPAGGLTLEELIATQRALLGSGLPIHAFNAVRKHLSELKGGGALRASRGPVLALLLSDVPGDDPGTIGSGPFAADPTTYAEALAAVAPLAVPERVRQRLAAGARGELAETVKPGDPELARVESVLIGSVATAVEAAAGEARRGGFAVATGELAGEAAAAGRALVERGRALGAGAGRVALILGGETTVTLGPAPGRGGRNQELALAAARALAGGRGELVLTLATDGEDGPTPYAGAIVDGASWAAIERAGLDPAAALAGHDAQTALAALPGALLETGRTGTNVGDLAVYLRLEGGRP